MSSMQQVDKQVEYNVYLRRFDLRTASAAADAIEAELSMQQNSDKNAHARASALLALF